jgi:hypothetical protein
LILLASKQKKKEMIDLSILPTMVILSILILTHVVREHFRFVWQIVIVGIRRGAERRMEGSFLFILSILFFALMW